MPVRSVPGSASVANPDGGKLFAPSAARNLAALCDLLDQVAPTSGTALELASGTGQHVIGYGTRLPGLTWQPSEVDPARRASIDAHVAEAGTDNIRPAIALDATAPGWSDSVLQAQGPVDLIMLSNLLHLISTPEAQRLIQEAATCLAPAGTLVIYGPFSRAGELTSEGDETFHASLVGHDPEIGYKDDFDVLDWAEDAGLTPGAVIEMPANNLGLVFHNGAT